MAAITLAIACSGRSSRSLAEPAKPAWRIDTPWTTETATVAFARDVVIAEIADTNELRSRGLGSRDGLADGRGMLFVFDQAEYSNVLDERDAFLYRYRLDPG